MFTGIIEEVGSIQTCHQSGQTMQLTIQCQTVQSDLKIGDSISVNGVCLTVTSFDDQSFTCDVMPETWQRTNFQHLHPGMSVNLERAMPASGRFGGHLVQGHVDGVGILQKKHPCENAVLFHFQASEELTQWMIPKGSIAINGVSLTLVDVNQNRFSVSLIPHTLSATQLNELQIGDEVNLECDLVGKYIAKWAKHPTALSIEKLQQVSMTK